MGRKASKPAPKRDLEIDDIAGRKMLDVERLGAWVDGRGTPFEALLPRFVRVVPPPDLKFLCAFLELAWNPETAIVLEGVIEEARRDPGRAGYARALRSARRVWRDLFVSPLPNRGGRRKGSKQDIAIYMAFMRARQADLKASKVKIFDAMTREQRAKYGLTSFRKFEEVLKRVPRNHPWLVERYTKPRA